MAVRVWVCVGYDECLCGELKHRVIRTTKRNLAELNRMLIENGETNGEKDG